MIDKTEMFVVWVVVIGFPVVIFSNYNPMLFIAVMVALMIAFIAGWSVERHSKRFKRF